MYGLDWFIHSRSVQENHLYIGEIDLFRHLRSLTPELVTALRHTLDVGDIQLPVTRYRPVAAADQMAGCSGDVTVVPCCNTEDSQQRPEGLNMRNLSDKSF